MNLSFHIARRYLFAKKSHNAINIISFISVCGIAVATLAMVCVLSIFNGFTDIVAKSFNEFDPQLRVIPATGKVFDGEDERIKKVRQLSSIELVTETLEENALLQYYDRQQPVLMKGVAHNYIDLANMRNILVDGEFMLREGDLDYGVIGAGLAMNLGVRAGFVNPVEIYIPKRNVRVNMANPMASFAQNNVFIGGVFSLNQEQYDTQLILVDIELMRELLSYESEISSLDIKLKADADISSVQNEIEELLGNDFLVQDQFQQHAEMYRMVSIEKWFAFFILSIILLIAVFNIVGSLSMLIIEKMDDVRILQSLGANNRLITRIFMIEGWLITFVGAIVGLVLGLGICLAQQYFGLLKLGDPGAFAVDYYPVVVQPLDILISFLTVGILGVLAVLYPVNNLRKQL